MVGHGFERCRGLLTVRLPAIGVGRLGALHSVRLIQCVHRWSLVTGGEGLRELGVGVDTRLLTFLVVPASSPFPAGSDDRLVDHGQIDGPLWVRRSAVRLVEGRGIGREYG